MIAKNQCRDGINQLLNVWEISNGHWSAVLNDQDRFSYVHSTKKFAVWIKLDIQEKKYRFEKHSPGSVIQVSFDENCKQELKTKKVELVKTVKAYDYDDARVFSFLKKHANGIIYFWSSGMVLSVEGIRTANAAAKELGLPLLLLADQNQELADLQKALKKHKIPNFNIYRNASSDFYFRRVHIHFPNLLVFKDGKIVDGMYPGLATKEEYLDFIKKQMEKTK